MIRQSRKAAKAASPARKRKVRVRWDRVGALVASLLLWAIIVGTLAYLTKTVG